MVQFNDSTVMMGTSQTIALPAMAWGDASFRTTALGDILKGVAAGGGVLFLCGFGGFDWPLAAVSGSWTYSPTPRMSMEAWRGMLC